MPRLVLVRHAKAEAPSAGQADFDRPLTLRGRESASGLAANLVEAGITAEFALVSAAARCSQTWKIMSASFPQATTEEREDLYEASPQVVRDVVSQLSDEVQTVIVVGHEPTMSLSAARFSGEGSETKALKRVAHGLPTGTAAVLEWEGTWADFERAKAKLVAVHTSDAHF